MNIDLHSHFFPLEAFQKAAKFQGHGPEIKLTDGRYSVTSRGGSRGNLSEGAYNVEARVRELDKMSIDLQAISPSPILLYYWDLPEPAAYFSRLQNEAIQLKEAIQKDITILDVVFTFEFSLLSTLLPFQKYERKKAKKLIKHIEHCYRLNVKEVSKECGDLVTFYLKEYKQPSRTFEKKYLKFIFNKVYSLLK